VPGLPPCDINWGKRTKLMQPDVYVAPRAMRRAVNAARSSVEGWQQITHLLLVVEVLSPKTASNDRGIKRRAYQQEGVPVYWIVDERAQAVEVWTPDASEPRMERERLVWHPDGAPVPFELGLAELFRPL
jgi:Uma2 family endonuclease